MLYGVYCYVDLPCKHSNCSFVLDIVAKLTLCLQGCAMPSVSASYLAKIREQNMFFSRTNLYNFFKKGNMLLNINVLQPYALRGWADVM